MEWFNYHHLFYFWTVCKEGGYAKAAKKLLIAQSAVSHQVAKLEDFLGERLMERGPRGFTLTEAGEVTFAQADEIFRQGNDLLQYFRSGKMKASFRIGALGGLSKNLQLRILYSVIEDSSVELSLEVGDAGVLLDRLLTYKLDAVLSDLPFPSSEAEPLLQKEIGTEPICFVRRVKPKGPSAKRLSEAMKNGVYLPAKSNPITASILDFLAHESKLFTTRGFVDDISLLRLLALETDALVAIPRIGVLRELEAGELFVVHEFKKVRQRYFLICREKGKRHPVLARLSKA